MLLLLIHSWSHYVPCPPAIWNGQKKALRVLQWNRLCTATEPSVRPAADQNTAAQDSQVQNTGTKQKPLHTTEKHAHTHIRVWPIGPDANLHCPLWPIRIGMEVDCLEREESVISTRASTSLDWRLLSKVQRKLLRYTHVCLHTALLYFCASITSIWLIFICFPGGPGKLFSWWVMSVFYGDYRH